MLAQILLKCMLMFLVIDVQCGSGVLQRRSPAKRRKAIAHAVEPTSVAPANGGEFNNACTSIDSLKSVLDVFVKHQVAIVQVLWTGAF